ncbi:HAD-IIIC family phosphatase [Ruminococcus flavefaciens]|uniref:HAD-IIIC family phosphatase n=1 Tax=Ruminococcus flavefaciens TaxID=1265 RepID=UPI00048B1571|nr:HAD-IIIC family phosphatase [Ruminococcus flavefaciens]
MDSRKIKCVVWDLDNTLWDGILSEDGAVSLKQNVVGIIKELDRRGILQSICSKNDYTLAMNKLREFGLDDMFIYPQISWEPKSKGIKEIRDDINIAMDSIAFIDDDEFERKEVNFSVPEVLCVDAADIDGILENDAFIPKYITNDSKNRRLLYQTDIKRNKAKDEFKGTEVDFLKMLDMKFIIDKVHEDDLARAEELTVRTHQLNSTGITFSYDELKKLSEDPGYVLLIAELKDVFGDYGKIGLSLIEKGKDRWTIKMLLMSCRVMSRGVGAILINYISKMAKKNNVDLYAEFIHTDVNRSMYVTYKFNGFKKVSLENDIESLKQSDDFVGVIPDYVKLIDDESIWN